MPVPLTRSAFVKIAIGMADSTMIVERQNPNFFSRVNTDPINEDDESRLSPLRHAHINMLGHYTFTLAEQVTKGQLRPLKQAEESDEWPL